MQRAKHVERNLKETAIREISDERIRRNMTTQVEQLRQLVEDACRAAGVQIDARYVFDVFVIVMPPGNRMVVQTQTGETIRELKAKIMDKVGIPATDFQVFLSNNRRCFAELDDLRKTVEQEQIFPDDHIVVQLKKSAPRFGPQHSIAMRLVESWNDQELVELAAKIVAQQQTRLLRRRE